MSDFNPAVPPMSEAELDGLRRAALVVTDVQLDELLAVVVARRDVNVAHKYLSVADLWNQAAMVLAEVRDERRRDRGEFEDITSPVQFRPMTPEELAEVDWPDDEGDG